MKNLEEPEQNIEQIIERAKQVAQKDLEKMQQPAYLKTVAWLHYLGLLNHNQIAPKRHQVTLSEALAAGELEPRIFELLPVIMVKLPKAFTYSKSDVCEDLQHAMNSVRNRQLDSDDFRGVPSQKYLYWGDKVIFEFARRKMMGRRLPRRRFASRTNAIADVIKNGRFLLAMTQRQLAKEYSVSLRVLRDLEQGKMDASLKVVNKILKIFGRQLRA
ncbi:MAG: helix-turn-helix domain-containing protein [Proteobacteria bacterium]|nr:helix-turn-helix domain-containing protein [Pseudomonadota bacterium]